MTENQSEMTDSLYCKVKTVNRLSSAGSACCETKVTLFISFTTVLTLIQTEWRRLYFNTTDNYPYSALRLVQLIFQTKVLRIGLLNDYYSTSYSLFHTVYFRTNTKSV